MTKQTKSKVELQFIAETNSVALYWVDGPAEYGVVVAPGFVVSYDANDRAIGIEVEGGARELFASVAQNQPAEVRPQPQSTNVLTANSLQGTATASSSVAA